MVPPLMMPPLLQLCVLQFCWVTPKQSAPPLAGMGLVHERVCVPPPQVTEHVLHADHPPGTETAIRMMAAAVLLLPAPQQAAYTFPGLASLTYTALICGHWLEVAKVVMDPEAPLIATTAAVLVGPEEPL
jgi:hypothetical protein